MVFLINNESLWDPFHGYTFWIGIIRGIEPPFINFIDFGAVRWFNETFFSADRAGQGFTLVGEGYINFGYFGIIILFIFVGLLIKFLYLKSNKNIYWFPIYLLSIPTFMYSIRADLANIISPLFSQIITTILIILLTNYLGKQLANKTNK